MMAIRDLLWHDHCVDVGWGGWTHRTLRQR